jgi:hypothetical protein
LPKPECDEDRYCESAKRNCERAQEHRSEFRGWILYATVMATPRTRLHGDGAASISEFSRAAYVHLGPIVGSARDWEIVVRFVLVI